MPDLMSQAIRIIDTHDINRDIQPDTIAIRYCLFYAFKNAIFIPWVLTQSGKRAKCRLYQRINTLVLSYVHHGLNISRKSFNRDETPARKKKIAPFACAANSVFGLLFDFFG
jgi:hypothetical protein